MASTPLDLRSCRLQLSQAECASSCEVRFSLQTKASLFAEALVFAIVHFRRTMSSSRPTSRSTTLVRAHCRPARTSDTDEALYHAVVWVRTRGVENSRSFRTRLCDSLMFANVFRMNVCASFQVGEFWPLAAISLFYRSYRAALLALNLGVVSLLVCFPPLRLGLATYHMPAGSTPE